MADYHCERLSEGNAAAWEGLRIASPEGTLFHSLKWMRIAERQAGAPWCYHLLYKNESVCGLFPLAEHTIHGYRGFVPASFPMTLNAVINECNDPYLLDTVIDDLQRMYWNRKRISFVCTASLRSDLFDTITTHPVFPYPFDRYYDGEGEMILDLRERPPEAIWDSFSARSAQRKYIRRFEENGFTITEVRSEAELRRFYDYYSANIAHIGGTHSDFSHFLDMWTLLHKEIRISLLSKGSIIAGGLLQLRDLPRKTVYAAYLSLNRNLPNTYHPTVYLFWEAVNWAHENRFERLSFGREYVQDLKERNPRTRNKQEFGARFVPMFSRIVPLTRIFAMGIRYTNHGDVSYARHQYPAL